jgi:hypothetical protein
VDEAHHWYTDLLVGQGVRVIDRVARAETYERRYELVGARHGRSDAPIFLYYSAFISPNSNLRTFYQDPDSDLEKF